MQLELVVCLEEPAAGLVLVLVLRAPLAEARSRLAHLAAGARHQFVVLRQHSESEMVAAALGLVLEQLVVLARSLPV